MFNVLWTNSLAGFPDCQCNANSLLLGLQLSHITPKTTYPNLSRRPRVFHSKGKMSPPLTKLTGSWAYGKEILVSNPLTMKTSIALESSRGKLGFSVSLLKDCTNSSNWLPTSPKSVNPNKDPVDFSLASHTSHQTAILHIWLSHSFVGASPTTVCLLLKKIPL